MELFTFVHTYHCFAPYLLKCFYSLCVALDFFFFFLGAGVVRSVGCGHASHAQSKVTFWIFVNLFINNIYIYSVCTYVCTRTYIYTTTYIYKCNAIGFRIHTYSNIMYVCTQYIYRTCTCTYENEHDDDISHRV